MISRSCDENGGGLSIKRIAELLRVSRPASARSHRVDRAGVSERITPDDPRPGWRRHRAASTGKGTDAYRPVRLARVLRDRETESGRRRKARAPVIHPPYELVAVAVGRPVRTRPWLARALENRTVLRTVSSGRVA